MADNKSRSAVPQRWTYRMHRWLGVGSIVFILLLSITGIALNHANGLSLGRHYIRAPWLLEWYGVTVPAPQASFTAAAHRISLIGERLYYDNNELTDGVFLLAGAVSTPSFVAIATSTDVFLVTPGGTLVERVDTQTFLPGEITAIGVAGAALVLRSGETLYETDENMLTVSPCLELDVAGVQWSISSAIPEDHLVILQELYRGRGLSLEQLILDLHSGKILGRVGPVLMDAAGLLFIALSVVGLIIWAGRNGKQRPSS